MTRIVDEGHTLGNHLTEDRPSIRDNLKTFEGKIKECENAIMKYQIRGRGKHAHKMKSKWLRPASGWFTSQMFHVIQKHGYRVCLGSVYPHDAQIKSEFINSLYLKNRTKSGSILLVHDRPWTIGVLKEALPDLTSDFKFISVDELYDLHESKS
uniref:Carbohydrate esterase putative n=1 Tax=Albugo laibachii Nc14 TaxID=890382 RepID=F0W3X4_9STRA|nr:carbohydrate esterase putative [Albugo laibachii Nc14]|eukprot:CCA15769.1 carbohydrate esterase putative [Albugo laibachii Nc14]